MCCEAVDTRCRDSRVSDRNCTISDRNCTISDSNCAADTFHARVLARTVPTRLLSEKMAAGGYASHFIGKGHLGWQTDDHLLVNRGFESHVGYVCVRFVVV